MHWQVIIGLEIHVQLNTQSKLFSGSATSFGAKPNEHASLIDLGMPGTLPTINQAAVEKAIRFGLAIDATINQHTFFERKNYFYPDLPKGYQTSQLQAPIVEQGYIKIEIDDEPKKIEIERAHLEEDAGKLIHNPHENYSQVDLNRAGVPLLEVVTTPCIYSAKEAVSYMKTLHRLVRHLDICTGNMQEGAFRCDVNISLKKPEDKELGIRTEIKNLNSFRFVEKAINYEIHRQKTCLENGKTLIQETRLYCPEKDETRAMRSKEQALDYRYFPCPDLLPLNITDDWIKEINKTLPESIEKKKIRLRQTYLLDEEQVDFLIEDLALSNFFETLCKKHIKSKTVFNWLKGPFMQMLNQSQLTLKTCPISEEKLAPLLKAIDEDKLTFNAAKAIFDKIWQSDVDIYQLIKENSHDASQDESSLLAVIDEVLLANPKQMTDLKAGKDKLLGFFVGQVMKKMQGKSNPKKINEALRKKLLLP